MAGRRDSSTEYEYETLSPTSRSQDSDGTFRGKPFMEFFANPKNRDALWDFMMQEFYEEHMLFYQACLNYPYVNDYLTAAQDIQNLYLQPGAVFYCPIPPIQYERIREEIETGMPSESLFDPLGDCILQQIGQDSFVRFSNTERGRAMVGMKLWRNKKLWTGNLVAVAQKTLRLLSFTGGTHTNATKQLF